MKTGHIFVWLPVFAARSSYKDQSCKAIINKLLLFHHFKSLATAESEKH